MLVLFDPAAQPSSLIYGGHIAKWKEYICRFFLSRLVDNREYHKR